MWPLRAGEETLRGLPSAQPSCGSRHPDHELPRDRRQVSWPLCTSAISDPEGRALASAFFTQQVLTCGEGVLVPGSGRERPHETPCTRH